MVNCQAGPQSGWTLWASLMSLGLLVCLVSTTALGQTGSSETGERERILKQRNADIAGQLEALLGVVDRQDGIEAWRSNLETFRSDIRRRLAEASPVDRQVFEGADGYLFNIGALRTLLSDEMPYGPIRTRSSATKSPAYHVIADFSRQLRERGIDLILVPIPYRSAYLAELLSENAPRDYSVSPEIHGFLVELLRADVEVIDLWTPYLAEKDKSELFLKFDHHWSNLGLQIASKTIAERLARYDFSRNTPSQQRFSTVKESTSILGSSLQLVEDASGGEEIEVDSVLDSDGTPYRSPDQSPVLLTGDSFVNIYGSVSANLAAHLAKDIGIDVSYTARNGGGASVPIQLARKGPDYLKERRVVVWVFNSNILLPYMDKLWRAVKLPD